LHLPGSCPEPKIMLFLGENACRKRKYFQWPRHRTSSSPRPLNAWPAPPPAPPAPNSSPLNLSSLPLSSSSACRHTHKHIFSAEQLSFSQSNLAAASLRCAPGQRRDRLCLQRRRACARERDGSKDSTALKWRVESDAPIAQLEGQGTPLHTQLLARPRGA